MLGDDAATAPARVGACAFRARAERYPRGLVEHLVHPAIVLRAAFCACGGSIRVATEENGGRWRTEVAGSTYTTGDGEALLVLHGVHAIAL